MVRIVIVAHEPLASALQHVAAHAFPEQTDQVHAIDVGPSDSLELVCQRLAAVVAADDSTLILSDVFGATPCNAAMKVADGVWARVLSGANVPMLWRVLSYASQPLDRLVGLAQSGATHGVMQVASTRPQNQMPLSVSHDPNYPEDQ
jgi:mannose PTS system EIIA component